MQNGKEIPKQRGIYSEILTTEDTTNLNSVSTFGPDNQNLILVNEKQKMPRALGIRMPSKKEVLQEIQAKMLSADQTKEPPIIGREYFRNPEVNFGFYSKKREGVADVDPKVMEPFKPIPGKPPRKVVIDRQRKLFASLEIEELLAELGINYQTASTSPADWLPLEPFDDTEYDCRLPEEWISFGYDQEGDFHPIPGKGLRKNPDGSGYWCPVVIQSYDSTREVYSGYWDTQEKGEYTELTRINLLFNSEDPRIFAKRVAQAHHERIYADSQIRYNFFIDMMPIAELPDLDTEQQNRIQSMAVSCRYLKNRTPDYNSLMWEVTQDFQRTMNQIIMEKTMKMSDEQRKDMVPANLLLPEPAPPKKVDYYGQIKIPDHDFPDQFSNFCFHSLFIKDEVIRAMVQIREECNLINRDSRVFNVKLNGKTMRVEEFKQNQMASIGTLKYATREQGWVEKLQRIIKTSFESVGKGWFYLQEKKKETYEFGKLKKFLTLVNFMMQDTVLNLCKDSVNEFVEFILDYIPLETKIINTATVKNSFAPKANVEQIEECGPFIKDTDLEGVKETKSWLNSEFKKKKDPQPLYVLDLILKPGNLIPNYSTNPTQVVQSVREVFEEGIKCLQEIPQLEPRLLQHLFKTHAKKTIKAPIIPQEKPKIPKKEEKKALIDENLWLWDAFEKLIVNLERAVQPLDIYVKTFEAFKAENDLNSEKYVKSLDDAEKGISPEELKQDILKMRKKELELMDRIPESVIVGMFQINCKDIRNMYAAKYRDIVDKEIKLIAQKARDNNYSLTARFGEISEKIQKPPKTIDEMTDTKKYIADVGIQIEKMKKEIDECMQMYNLLDEFGFELPGLAQQNKWELYGQPQKTAKIMEQTMQGLEKMREQMTKQMELEQEEFNETLENIQLTVGGFYVNDNAEKYMDIAKMVDEIEIKLQECMETARMYNQREFLVGKEQRDYSCVANMIKEFQPFANLWKTNRTWNIKSQSWLNGNWSKLDPDDLDTTFENCNKIASQAFRFFRDKNDLKNIFSIAEKMKAQIDKFKPIVPLACALRKQGMYDRHWDALQKETGVDCKPDEDFTLQKLVNLGMVAHVQKCEDIGEKANKEYFIEKSLKKMKADWVGQNFLTPQFKNTTTNFIAGFEDAANLLDEHIVTGQAMQFSPFKGPFVDEIENWVKKLMTVQETLEEWLKCQGQWMYLQPIFDSPDIMKQLPGETKRFKAVDSKWRFTLQKCKDSPAILENCSAENLKESFQESNKNLDMVQKGLTDYLEKKRGGFARFYFLSNDELLEILSQTKEVRMVRSHLRKVFEAISDLTFQDDDCMTAMISGEGEKIEFVKKIDPKDRNVEFWMGDVERQMIASVRNVIHFGITDYLERERNDWIVYHPGQIVLNSGQVHWTADVEKALLEGGLDGITTYWKFLQDQLNNSVMLVRKKLSKLARVSVNALIVIDVHAKDVIGTLVEQRIDQVTAFAWVSQLRYYWYNDDKGEDQMWCKCVSTTFPYGYEYLGNSNRLVITPLTDKCYMTLMGALQLNLGGAPAGPAGTGKTESTKDLAKALAKQCVVFNCSDGMDHLMVAKFFKGLCASGAWCCFDEFNRINIEVLSVIAQFLLQLFGSKAKLESEITFEGSTIKMKPTFCVFITMNPGYAGRTELPDNLKALFRPVAMMVPDYALIGEIRLYSFGFIMGRVLAKKMVTTFTLASEQLSSQCHYDYGMRAVTSVINAAGLLKTQYPDMDESQLLLRALRDVNVPKFLRDDLPLFENIISDLFPGVEKPYQEYGNLFKAIDKVCAEKVIQNTENFNLKIIQLYDTILVRHGLMLVGPTGGGKTSNYKVLQAACTSLKEEELFEKVHTWILNPKSITMDQLYGYSDPQTTEWQDGCLAKLVNDSSKDESPDKHWIYFDGPVDALWIENMNTVLDDNKKLCLNSGQIIQLTPRMTMMFEVEDLAVASPATVSRCGMVYMEPQSLGLQPLLTSWMLKLPAKVGGSKSIVKTLTDLFADMIDDGCYFVRRNMPEMIRTVDNNIVQSCLRLLDCHLNKYIEDEDGLKKIPQEAIDALAGQIKQIFCFCFIWSIGATSGHVGRERFDKWMRERMEKHGIKDFPAEKKVYDWFLNVETNAWQGWFETIPEFSIDTKTSYAEIVVPTQDSIRMKYLMKILIQNDKHILMPGPTGTGKSVYVQELVTYGMSDVFQTLVMCFSAQTSANQTQDYLDDKMEKRRKGIYGPPLGKKFIVFVDDLNMPKKEEYGAQPPIELIRQWMDYKGWYERKSKEKPFWTITDIIFVSAMGPPGGGRANVTQRLQRHYNIIAYTEMSFDAITTIFTTIANAFFATFSKDVLGSIDKLLAAQLEVYDQILNGPLKPTPNKSHYTFNLRDISKIFQGVVSANSKLCVLPVELLRIWIHENTRVFGDRMINEGDRNFLQTLMLEKSIQHFGVKKELIFNAERLLFTDFMEGIDVDVRIYRQIEDLKKFQTQVEFFLEEYNGAVKKQMALVMFLDACDHVSRIHRVIRQPLGNAFLLGVGGSGRQSLSRLATYCANYKMYQIEVIKGYGMMNWREDVKKALMQAGAEGKQTSFLFVDTQIVSELQLEDINNILNGGDVPNLYKAEDFEAINKVGKAACMEKNIQVTKMNMFQQYLGRLRKNIHMIIAMSPLGEVFRSRIRQFPSLVTCSTIDWFSEWPEEALLGVGRGQVMASDLDLGKDLDNCVEVFKSIHMSVSKKSTEFADQLNRKNYVTPTSFLEQLAMYMQILKAKRIFVGQSKERLVKGLDVLGKAGIEIEKLEKQISDMAPVLAVTKAALAETMIVLAKEKADAAVEQAIVAKDEAEAKAQEQEAAALKEDAEFELGKAVPMLAEATRVLSELKKDDLYSVAGVKVPTPNVVVCMEVACHMFQLKPEKKHLNKSPNDLNGYFECARVNLLSNPTEFLKKMMTYDKENIPDRVVKNVNAIIGSPDFKPDDIKKASEALLGICKWAMAMMKYYELLKIVNPKRAKVAEMNIMLKEVRARLAEKMAKLREVEEMMARLEATYQQKLAEEAALVQKIDDCNKKLERAGKIIGGLAGEKQRWTDTVARLGSEFDYLVGNCLIAAGMVAYSGAFTAQFRAQLEEEWNQKISSLGVKVAPKITMKEILEDPVQTKTWTANSLPNDQLSIENAIIMFKSRRWPLMIDPQSQANKFIKNLSKDAEEAPAGLENLKMSDPQLLRMLELAIQYGKWFLIENVGEDLDPALEPILLKQVDKSGSLRLGDKSIPWNPDFKFFMTTTIPNPHYTPETQVKVTVLNFAITPFGLEEQMLNQFISQEMPDLQKKKDMIVQQNAQAAKSSRDIENRILFGLNKHADIGKILEDDELINVLAEAKITNDAIAIRMEESKATEYIIDKTRETFRVVAYRASILFFSIVDLAVINSMYQYSLQWFSNLFGSSVNDSPKAPDNSDQRILNLNNHFTLNLYENVCRSLFEKDKLLFSFKLTVNILGGDGKMDQDEMRFFLAGPSGDIPIPPNPTKWLGDLDFAETYKQIYKMNQILPAFAGLEEFFLKNHLEFEKIYDSETPENQPLPGEWNKKLNSFQKMIVLKSLRPDKITLAIQNYIIENLGKQFVEPPVFNLAKSFKDSSISTPLIFVLSTGSDPVADFMRFAEEMNMQKKIDQISLGRGQGPKAAVMINDNLTRGGWVLLMNCHLAVSWMPKLEQIVESIDDTKHRDFRLWLTSMPSAAFPVSVLQNSVKMTLEPPSGLKQNVLGTYEALDDNSFGGCTKPQPYKKLLFGFCFFHAIVQDRRKFGPIGWNIPYAFTNEDLMVSRRQLKIFIEDFDEVPYQVLNYIGAEINYGGRVTDDKDVRLIKTILQQYITPDIMIDNYQFSPSGFYKSIPTGDKEDYIDYIKNLPLNPQPEAFGLHNNAEITTNQIRTFEILESMISMQPRTAKGKGKTREQIIGEQAAFLAAKTPEVFDLEFVQKRFPTSYEESMNTVLFQECVRYNAMLAEMKVSLIQVQRALLGEVVMDEMLDAMATSIFDNMVPKNWSSCGFLSMKPLASWIVDCNARITFLNEWYEKGTPIVFWVSGFFFPQAFLTGTMQNYARQQKIAIDKLSFEFLFQDSTKWSDIKEKPQSGCLVYGIYLEGCKWDYETHRLGESDPKKLFVELPLMHLHPVLNRVKPETGIYNCPVYKVLSRTGTLSTTGHSTNYVIMMELPTVEAQNKWIIAGVACFLALKF